MARKEITEGRGKSYIIDVRSIVSNTNPRNPLSDELQKQHYTVFGGDTPLWPLAVSDSPEDRALFVKIVQEGDPEFCSWATTFMTQGQLQPVEVRDNGDKSGEGNSTYTLVFGARRCLAILYNWCLTGKPKDPVVEVRLIKGSNVNLLHRAFVENERKNPSIIEDAESIKMAINAGCTEEEVANARGISMSTIKNRLALLDLEPKVQRKIKDGSLSPTKALQAAKASSNGNGSHVDADSPKVRSKKEIRQAMEEFSEGTETYRTLAWVLGVREKIG